MGDQMAAERSRTETVRSVVSAPRRTKIESAGPRAIQHNLHSVQQRRFLARLRYQLFFGLLIVGLLPTLIYNLPHISQIWTIPSGISTAIGSVAAFILSLYIFRRALSFPGVGVVGHVLPACVAGYGIAVAAFFGFRLDYSRITFLLSFVLATGFFFVVSSYLRRRSGQRFFLVPSERTRKVPQVPFIEWVVLEEPRLPPSIDTVLVADLRADLGPEWERLIADTALEGYPVYHVKQVMESLTGRVEMEHLSENSFGSLVPNSGYWKTKRFVDLLTAPLAFCVLAPSALLVAGLIKLDSPGPVFFRQPRLGHKGKVFNVLKFRTMIHGGDAVGCEMEQSITQESDQRITRVGRFLRRTRIDELPQILNIIRGEMSWIGPRPEALPLSNWYAAELPFYRYRHIVRPGITGWAQVHQGHVADLSSVNDKLGYDFFYIKNFSAWLDLLIIGKTIRTVFTGFGAR